MCWRRGQLERTPWAHTCLNISSIFHPHTRHAIRQERSRSLFLICPCGPSTGLFSSAWEVVACVDSCIRPSVPPLPSAVYSLYLCLLLQIVVRYLFVKWSVIHALSRCVQLLLVEKRRVSERAVEILLESSCGRVVRR